MAEGLEHAVDHLCDELAVRLWTFDFFGVWCSVPDGWIETTS